MAAKFEISKDKSGKFRFHLKAANGEIIAASQGYDTKAGAEKGIEAVKTSAPAAEGRRPDRTTARAQLTRVSRRSSCAHHEDAARAVVVCVRTYWAEPDHRLADAAKVGDWSTVFDLLDDPEERVDINWWRPGGPAWFTVLHQAAWHGATCDVAAELIRHGALRSLRDSRGRTAYDIRCQRDLAANHPKGIAAQHRKSLVLRERYLKSPPSPLAPATIRALDRHLETVIDGRIRGVLYDGRDPQQVLRYPPVEILHEVPGQRLWFPVPGMYGGFDISLVQDFLDVKSWCHVVGGSGQEHLITTEGAIRGGIQIDFRPVVPCQLCLGSSLGSGLACRASRSLRRESV